MPTNQNNHLAEFQPPPVATFATLPQAGVFGRLRWVTGLGLFYDALTTWLPIFGGGSRSDFITVKSYPFLAKGDGVTDDQASIHAARDAAGPSGLIYFPPGTYYTSKLTANVASQKWILAPGAVLKAKTNLNDYLLTVSAANVTLEGGALDGNMANQSGTARVLNYNAVDGLTLRGVHLTGGKRGIMFIQDSNFGMIEDCIFDQAGDYGIYTNGATHYLTVKNSRFLNLSQTSSTYSPIVMQSVTPGSAIIGTLIDGNYFEIDNDSPYTVEIIKQNGDRPQRNRIVNNIAVGGATTAGGFSLGQNDDSMVSNNSFLSTGSAHAGVELNQCNGSVATNNILDGAKVGVWLEGGTVRDVVTGNVIKNWDISAGAGVQIVSGSTGQHMDDNVISSNTFLAAASNAQPAIWLQPSHGSVTCDRNVIDGNVCVSTGSGTGIKIQVSAGGADSNIITSNSSDNWGTKIDVGAATNTVNANNN